MLVECQRPLMRIVSTCAGVDQVIARNDPLPAFDVQAALLSLPRIFGTTVEIHSRADPVLQRRPVERGRMGQAARADYRTSRGNCLAGNDKTFSRSLASFPLSLFEKLARIDGVRLINLQKGHGVEQLRELNDRFPVIDFGDCVDPGLAEMKDTPAIMMSLDLVITPDTSLAHLAGALGVPVSAPISYVPDFRWLLDRDDSPWYPTVRLFRRASTGGWEAVFERMAQVLATRPLTRCLPAGHHSP